MSDDLLRVMQVALSHVADAVEIVDADGKFVFLNAAWERLSGYSASELLGDTPRRLRSDFHPPEHYDQAWAAVVSGERWVGEMVSRRKDGSHVFTRMDATPIFGPDGKQTCTVVIRHDLMGALMNVQKHGDRYAMAVLASRDGLSDWDLTTGEIYASQRWREIVGMGDSKAHLGRALAERIHPDDFDDVAIRLGTFFAGDERFFEAEFRVRGPDDAVVHVTCHMIALRNDDGVVTRAVGTLSDVTRRRESELQLVHNATHDALTGLANRGLFVQHIRAAIGRSSGHDRPTFGLLYIDLRRFKSINDAHGHAVGDQLLQSIARRLAGAVRPGDTVARLGGDEFGVLLSRVVSPSSARAAAGRILRQLEPPHEIDGQWLPCSVTIGVALGGARSEVDELVRSADTAMYEARMVDEQSVRVATLESGERAKRSARLTEGLRDALAAGALSVAYQPIMDMASLRVVAVESLARWTSKEFGPVSPAEFVPLAEQAQLAGRLGSFVLDKTLSDLAAWERQGLVGDRFRVHVNVSPRELLDGRLLGALSRVFSSSALRPARLCMEITETALVEHPELVVGNIRRIRELGITFALDDFGTGYSSLSHLRGFSVSCVKIDRSFVMQLPDDLVSRQIVRGLLTMTEALGLEVVAEGVEGPEHVSRLRALGCRFAQGFHYARPMDSASLSAWLLDRQT